MQDRRELLELVQAMRARLDWWKENGIETMPLAEAGADGGSADPGGLAMTPRPAAPSTREPVVASAGPAAVADGPEHADSLAALRTVIGDCQRCKLAPHRTNLVFGVGDPNADLVFVGEAPGRDEDLRGEPFVGRAGQLLTEIITKGMKIRREDVYIANIIKCRPPQNRNPEPDEIASCEPFLVRQLALIKPKAIVALGTFAAQTLLKTRTPITRLRGTWADYHGIPLMPTFHPAYLLRNPGDKRLVWQDIQQVMVKLGLR